MKAPRNCIPYITLFMLFSTLSVAQTFQLDLSERDYPYTRVSGEHGGDQAGLAVGAGDLDKDGYDDLLIGAVQANPGGRTNAGVTYVVFGSESLKNESEISLGSYSGEMLRIKGEMSGDQLGRSMATGDFNGDGYNDILVSAWHSSVADRVDAGKVYIIYGAADMKSWDDIDLGNTSRAVTRILGENGGTIIIHTEIPNDVSFTPGDELGICVSTGDINGDGFDDALLGAWYNDPLGRVDAGASYIVYGNSNMRNTAVIDLKNPGSASTAIYGKGTGGGYPDNSGFYLTCGNVDNDGFDDVIVGAKFADPLYRHDAGEMYVIKGSSGIRSVSYIDVALQQADIVSIYGEDASDYAGNRLGAGDVNGDGFDDILIDAFSADYPDRGNTGKAYVLFGSSQFFSTHYYDLRDNSSNKVTIIGEFREDHLGKPSSGDINGDGIMDVLIQSNSADTPSGYDAGVGYVIFGSPVFNNVIDLRQPGGADVRISGDKSGGNMGFCSWSADLNGDGFSEAIFGAHGNGAGDTYIIWGNYSLERYGHFTYMRNTGSNATILLSTENIQTAGALPLEAGDEIGVFTPDGICAGAGVWNEASIAITVWGDNSYTDRTEGFQEGGQFLLRVWDASSNTEYPMNVVFESNQNTYHADGLYTVSSLEVQLDGFVVQLHSGWNLVSAPIEPIDDSMHSVMIGISNEIIIAKNGLGNVYWPSYDIDSIHNWNYRHGYQIYMNNAAALFIQGDELPAGQVNYNLTRYWNLISYIGNDGMAPVNAFASLKNAFMLVKNDQGQTYWPEYGIDDIQHMQQGNGYWIYMHSPAAFQYPGGAGKPAVQKIADTSDETYFSPVSTNGPNAIVLIPQAVGLAAELETGDEIAVISVLTGICVGTAVWGDKNQVITIWGDNEFTETRDGLVSGETYRFIIRKSSEQEDVYYTAEYSQGSSEFVTNGIGILTTMVKDSSTHTDEGSKPQPVKLYQNSPNPFNPSTTISFDIKNRAHVSLRVFTVEGKELCTLIDNEMDAGFHSIVWDAQGISNGIYFYRLTAGSSTETKRMMLLK